MTKQKRKRKLFRVSMRAREALEGLFFVLPFIIGVAVFFAYPLFISLRLSVSQIDAIIGFRMSFVGIEHFTRAFLIDINFVPMFLIAIRNTLLQFPLTVLLALIIAVMLNKNIKGRGVFRVAIFIPFLLGTGEVMNQLLNQGVENQVLNILDGTIIPYNVLFYFGETVVMGVQNIFGMLVTVLWGSGVQVLLFLSGLQGISPALYESAKIDGATEWEMFWKITIPMISPMMLLVIIYTIADSFLDVRNPLLAYIEGFAFGPGGGQFAYSAALGWIYFSFILVVIGIVFGGMKRYIHTNEAERVKKDVSTKKKRILTIDRKRKY
ncbi:MAG: sugar ABC transporter permease [Defluviitaleaceae bacterium]|nr:sugar ABC transporter permease [Defluviitaleaceae bacterium]